jgi:hypothetical protein
LEKSVHTNIKQTASRQTLENLQHLLYKIYFSATSPLHFFSVFYNIVLQVRQAASIDLQQACEYRFTE